MKKKVLAFLLASTMIIEPFTVASAADFSDGMGQDTVQFSDDAEDVPEVENDDVDQFGTDAVGEGEESTETHVKIGDKVWVDFDDSTGTATISGTGDMWDFYENGYDYSGKHQNPFVGKKGIKKIIVTDGITSIGDYLLYGYNEGWYGNSLKEVLLGDDLKKIGDDAFYNCNNLKAINLPESLEKIGDRAFKCCNGLENIIIPDNVRTLGVECFSDCTSLKQVKFSDNLKNIPIRAFSNCGFTEIHIMSSWESIGQGAFSNCSKLENVYFDDGFNLNISSQMFWQCTSLKKVSIPSGVKSVETNAFSWCTNLTTITFEGATTYFSSLAYGSCPNFRTIRGYDCSRVKMYYDSLTKEQKGKLTFESLGEGKHQFTAEKVQIKEPTCTEKGIKANKCNICGVIDESSKEEIPAYDHKWDGGVITKQATETEEGVRTYTCRRCNKTKTEPIPKLPSIQIEDASYGWLAVNTLHIKGITNKDASYYVTYVPRGDDKPEYDQQHEREDTSDNYISAQITVPNYEIDVYIFAVDKNGNVTYAKITPDYTQRPQKPTIKVGDNVTATVNGDTVIITGTGETYDESWWFDDNVNQNNIKHITVEDGVTSLGSSIFYGFSQVKDVKLPTSLKNIGYGAFEKCDSLKELTIPEGVTNIGNGIINSCTSIKKISLPSTLNTIPRLIDMESTGDMQLDEIVLNDGIKTLGNYAFWNFRNLKNIIIPESVTNIGESAFHGCTALSNLTLPDSITEIAGEAFSNCVSLGKVTLPKNLTLLGNGVFENCNAEIIFPASLERIPELGMNAVRKVNIPEGVKIIGEDAFWACSNLKEITLPSTITSIESGAFFNTSISGFNYPQNIDSIPINAFCGTKLTEFSVPPKVTEINDDAFYNCTDLVKISIPESVKYIGTDVFKNCRNLTIYGYKDTAAESYAKANNIKFISADYKVVFKDNGRTQKTEYVLEGENATPPSLKEKPGYTLSWDADYTNIQEDMVINAVWTKKDNGGGNTTIIVSPSETNKYTVTFKDRGKIVKTEKVKSGDAAEYPYINRNGYELSWDKDFSKVTANITVNAVWTVIKPNKITSLTAEVQKTSIDLSWDRAENTDYYLVYRKATSDTEYKQIKKTTKILWTDEDVEPGTEYSYKVVGVCSVDGKKYQGADSDVVTAKIGTPQIGDVYSVGDLKYKVTGAKEVSVIGLAKEEVEIKIPSAVSISGKAYKVTSVQAKAFYQNEDIVSIAIGNNVTYVGKYAFYQCPNLETVKFGKRVSVISTCAFTQCPNLENVTLPSSIRRIGAKAFYQCTSIKVLKINGSVLEYVGKKGLAVNKTVTLRLPKKVYTKYRKLIKASGVYSKTKFVKF